LAVALVAAELPGGVSAAPAGAAGEGEERGEVGDELPAGSAAAAVQASAEAKASEVIRV
jgi:hypothetical protein